MPDNNKLNPQIMEVEIGIRTLRTIKIYPLSMADQFKMSGIITEGLQGFFEKKDATDIEFVSFLLNFIQKNIEKIIKLISDENPTTIIKELTNNQVCEIVDIIYNVNYKKAIKNVTSLFGTDFLSKRQLQQYVNDMDTDLNDSIQDHSETED